MYKTSYVDIDTYEAYRKMSFRNRCLIAGAQGIITLSVPLVKGRNQKLPVRQVLISYGEDWQTSHFRSIQSAYNRSPFFEYYRDELFDLYRKKKDFLADWNIECLNWVISKISWPPEIRFTEAAVPYNELNENDRRNRVLPKNYTNWNPVRYRQVFEERTGFFPNLSVLDVLFNEGPRCTDLFKNS